MFLEQDEFENTDFSFLCGGKTFSSSSGVVSTRPSKAVHVSQKDNVNNYKGTQVFLPRSIKTSSILIQHESGIKILKGRSQDET